MKAKLVLTILGSLMASVIIAQADDAAPAASTPATPAPATAEAQPAAPETQIADASTPAAAPAAVAEVKPAEAKPAEAAPVAAAETTAATPSVQELIAFDDTPLLDAIQMLARRGGINLIIDPKVAYGQPDPAKPGATLPQPTVKIRWENVTPDQALSALLTTYGLQAVEDPKIKITRITVKDPAAPDPLVTRIIQLQYAGPSNIVSSVTASFTDKRSKVVADVRTSQLVIVATEKELVEVERMIARLDTKTKQVLIEAKILETTMNPKTSKGVDWTGTLGGQNIKFGNGSTYSLQPTAPTITPDTVNGGATVTPGFAGQLSGVLGSPAVLWNTADGFNPGTGFLNADGLSATLSFLNTHTDTKVVSEPRMVTLDNQKASIDVGLLYPIVNTTAGTANAAGGSQIAYSNLTVNLEVTPRIAANDQVELKLAQSLLRLGPDFSSKVNGEDNVQKSFFVRQANTTVLVPSAHTLVLGGLISDENQKDNIKVPIVGDIPVLGALFRKDSKSRNKNNMIIFITPTIVGDGDYHTANSTFLKTKMESSDEPEWDAWDSGKARDWSKKGNGLKGPTK
jgi:type II secretory pathway component GspD/PulD (secretin)